MKAWMLFFVLVCTCGCNDSKSDCSKFGSEPYLQYKMATLREYDQCSAYFVTLTERGSEEQKHQAVYTIGWYRDTSKVKVLEAAVCSNRNSVVGISGINALRGMNETFIFERLLFSQIDLTTAGACGVLKYDNPREGKKYIDDLLERFGRGEIKASDPKFIKRLKRYHQEIQALDFSQ